MILMKYKGYFGLIEYSKEDNELYGNLKGIIRYFYGTIICYILKINRIILFMGSKW